MATKKKPKASNKLRVAHIQLPRIMQEKRLNPEFIESILSKAEWQDIRLGRKTTVVCCVLPNGFEIVESASCIDPAQYNHQLGVDACRRRIRDRLWLLEGYGLQIALSGLASFEAFLNATPAARKAR